MLYSFLLSLDYFPKICYNKIVNNSFYQYKMSPTSKRSVGGGLHEQTALTFR